MPKAVAAPAQTPVTAAETYETPPRLHRNTGTRRRRNPRRRLQSHPRNIRTREKPAPADARRDSDTGDVLLCPLQPPAELFRRAPTRCVWYSISTRAFDVARSARRWRHHQRCQPAASGEGPGDPHPPQPPADALARSRRPLDWQTWTLTFIDRGQKPPLPLMVVRNITDPQFANVNVPLANPGQLHRLVDPDAGGLVPGRWIAPRARRGVAVLKCCPRRCPAMEFSFKPLILFAMIPRYLRRPRQ